VTRDERTVIVPLDPVLAERLPKGERVILEIREEEETVRKPLVHLLRRKNVDIRKIIIHCRDVESFLHMEIRSFSNDFDISMKVNPEIGEIMETARYLQDDRYRFVLPLLGPRDALVIKLLSSLGVRILLDLRDPRFAWGETGELIADSLLNSAPRGPLVPLTTMLRSLREKDFFLGVVYYEDPRFYAWMDEKGNIALSDKDRREGRWVSAPLVGGPSEAELAHQTVFHPYDHLRSRSSCAFCEGFFLCRGYLAAYGQEPSCRAFFRAFFDAAQVRCEKEETLTHEAHPRR
jgi:hypothetical protein